jgi:hypothetical protein
MFTGFIITLLIVAATATAVGGSMVYIQRKRQLAGSKLKALPSSTGDKLLERTIADLRVGDILTYEGKDFLVEGVVEYDEDGHRWNAGRMVDGDVKHWAVIGMERGGAFIIRLMREDTSVDVEGYPPETLLVGEARFSLDKRGAATATMKGDTGLGRPNSEGLETSERCRWWLYDTPGEDTLIVEQWGNEFRVLRGAKVEREAIDMMPGS